MNLSIQAVGYNTEPMKGDYVVQSYGVGLYVCGLKRTRRLMPDGRETFLPGFGAEAPALRLFVPGMHHFFEYEDPRENWWVVLKEPAPFAFDKALHQTVWFEEGYTFPIPSAVVLEKAEVPASKRDTVVKKDMSVEDIAKEIVEWIKA